MPLWVPQALYYRFCGAFHSIYQLLGEKVGSGLEATVHLPSHIGSCPMEGEYI